MELKIGKDTAYDDLIYPNGMTKDPFYRVARINKQHAKYLLDSGLVPCINTGKKTRKYHIATHDVITYLCDREDSLCDRPAFMQK